MRTMDVDSPLGSLRTSPSPDARGAVLSSSQPCDSYSDISEIHSDVEPWTEAGVSRATWYRRSRPKLVEFRPIARPRWYVARTFHGQTSIADRAIREAGFDVFAPTMFRPATPARRDAAGVMRPGKPDRVEFLFVRYIIVSFDLTDPSWRRVLECDGVERMISGGHLTNQGVGMPIAIPDAEIARVRRLLGPNDCIDPRTLREKPIPAGTKLRLRSDDHTGICEMSDGQRVMMLMGWFNRDNVRTSVSQATVEAA